MEIIFSSCITNPLSGLLVLNSFPYDKNLDWSKFKGFADDKINVYEEFKFVLGGVEKIVGKGENACYHNVFKRFLFEGH